MARKWHNEPWRKLYTRQDGPWLRLPAISRSIASELLKYASDDGLLMRLRAGEEPGAAVAAMMGAREWERTIVAECVGDLLADGYLDSKDGALRIKNFVEAQRRETPATLRKRRQREREDAGADLDGEEDEAPADGVTGSVTSRVTVTPHVTPAPRDIGHAMSQGTRRDETRRDEQESTPPAPARDPGTPAPGTSTTPTPQPVGWNAGAFEALWTAVFQRRPGHSHRWGPLAERIAADAALLAPPRAPAPYAEELFRACEPLAAHARKTGKKAPDGWSVGAFEGWFDDLAAWVKRGGPPTAQAAPRGRIAGPVEPSNFDDVPAEGRDALAGWKG